MRREFSETRISLKFPAALATNWTRCPGFSLPCNPTWSSVSSQIVIFPLLLFLPNTAAIRGYKHNTSDISVRSTQHLFRSTFLRPLNREIVDLAIARREKILKNRGFVQSGGFFLTYSVQRIAPPALKKVIFQAVFLGEERVTVD